MKLSAKAQVIELGWEKVKTGRYISQALAIGELGKRHGKKLISTGEALDLVIAL